MIVCQIDYRDVFEVFAPLSGQAFAHLLSGGRNARESWGGEWRIIAAAPSNTLSVDKRDVYKDGQKLGVVADVSPFDVLGKTLAARATAETLTSDMLGGLPLPPFQGGAIGHITYEMAALLEPTLVLSETISLMPEMAFGFYDAVAIFHDGAAKAFLVGETEKALTKLQNLIDEKNAVRRSELPPAPQIETTHDQTTYVKAVERCQKNILEGDIFQANISQRLRAIYPDTLFTDLDVPGLLACMQENSAAAFGALLQYPGAAILSNSPERFFTVRQEDGVRHVTAEPVKGTRPRHQNPEEDRRIATELLGDEKDRAENIMIADLVRNDLSRVCEDHSILEEKICELQSFSHVHHLVSRISGRLRPGMTALDMLMASFPCGSITGAPKIRAMEVIAEIEQRLRGVYCGAIGFFDDRGGADFSVPIRTVEMSQTADALELSYGAGGGITVLSEPDKEYAETLDKAGTFYDLVNRDLNDKGQMK